jgi:hypothetical protein
MPTEKLDREILKLACIIDGLEKCRRLKMTKTYNIALGVIISLETHFKLSLKPGRDHMTHNAEQYLETAIAKYKRRVKKQILTAIAKYKKGESTQ